MNVISDDMAAPPRRSAWYQRPVVVLNWLAVVLTIGFFATFLWQAGMLEALVGKPAPAPPQDLTQEKVVVKASSVKGFDDEDQPYTIESRSAAQDPDKPNLIALGTVTGQ
ncbi:MAG: hypothetical protein ACR2OM_15230, partial [Aestuariivirgaceae bacterium]